MLGASARSPAGRPCAWKIHDTETLCESSFWTQVRDLQKLSKKVEQQEREPKRARKHSSPFDTLPSPAQCARSRCASPPTLPICTCAAPIEPACCGLQLDFASLQLGDEDDAWPLSADGIGTEGLRTGQKVLAPPLDDSISERPGSPHVPAKHARNSPVARQAPPKLEVPSHALPTPSPPPGPGGDLATRRLAGTVSASPGEEEPRANKGQVDCDMSLAHSLDMEALSLGMQALPRDAQGLTMWPRFEGLLRPVVESESDWSSDEE